jgi:hypothetical protein
MPPSAPNNILRPALDYESLPDGRVRWTLCPHDCTIGPGHRGARVVWVNRRGRLFTLVRHRIVAAELDPIEKKPLFHFLPGSQATRFLRSAVIFMIAFVRTEEQRGLTPLMLPLRIPLRGRYGMNTVTHQAESLMRTER